MECKKVHLHIFYQIFKYCVSVQFLDIIFTWVFYAMSYFHTNILTPCFYFYFMTFEYFQPLTTSLRLNERHLIQMS